LAHSADCDVSEGSRLAGSAVKSVLVTGATGCIGRHVLPLLVARGFDVHATWSTTPPSKTTGVTWHHANLLNPTDAERVIGDGCTTHLLHLAWYIAPGKWAMAPENFAWLEAGLQLIRIFRDMGGRRVVVAGSCLEYDWAYGYCSEERTPLLPRTIYGTCKHSLQLATAAMSGFNGVTTAWGRLFFLYGPHEHPDRLVASAVRSILAGQPAQVSHGRQIRDYLYVADVADAFVRLVESDVTGPINIAGGQPTALKDIVSRIGALMGRPDLIQLGAIPPAPTDMPLVVADTTRLAERLGWTPSWDLDKGLRATIDWWRAQ
jgi:nucleoside-diphosphate-sugar epimerase